MPDDILQRQVWAAEFEDLESTLSVHQLRVLLKISAAQSTPLESDRQVATLAHLGLVEWVSLNRKPCVRLTEKGSAAARFWTRDLEQSLLPPDSKT